MKRHEVKSTLAPAAIGPYSQGMKALAPAYTFTSGQIGIDPVTGKMAESVKAQTGQCLKNILAVAQAAGGDRASIVRTTVYLNRIEDFAAMNEVYAEFFEEPYPARVCLGGCSLPKGALIEIEAIVALED